MGVPTAKQADPLGDNVQLDEAIVQLEDGSTTELFKKVR